MRTTLTLDGDVARLLDRESRRSGALFKAVVNHFLRLGLMASKRPARRLFAVAPRKVGLPPGLTYDNVELLLDAVEGPAHRIWKSHISKTARCGHPAVGLKLTVEAAQ